MVYDLAMENTKKISTVAADADRFCDCCGRTHRKLYNIDGLWMGKTCSQDYDVFKWHRDITSLAWSGHEKTYRKVADMVERKHIQLPKLTLA